MTLKKAKIYRFLLRFLFVSIAFIVPIVIICIKFDIFYKASPQKISILGLLLILLISWRFKKKLGEWITSWENSNIFKHIIIGISKVWPFLLLVAILFLIKYSAVKILDDILFCLEWAALCELFAYLVLYPIEMKMDYIVKRMVRKQERTTDYKDAIKEMKEEESHE